MLAIGGNRLGRTVAPAAAAVAPENCCKHDDDDDDAAGPDISVDRPACTGTVPSVLALYPPPSVVASSFDLRITAATVNPCVQSTAHLT